MDRHRPPHVAQGTWRSGSLHVWGWNGIDTASMAWLYGGFRSAENQRGWHDSPVSYGAIGRVSIDVGSRTLHASSVRLDPLAATVWLSDVPEPPVLSDSLAWFARLTTLLSRQGRHDEALATLDEALAERDDLILARQEKGESLWLLGRRDEAVSVWTDAVQRNARLALVNNELAGAARLSGNLEQADVHEKQADQFTPDNSLYHWVLARRLQNLGMTELAEKHFQRAGQLDPENSPSNER